MVPVLSIIIYHKDKVFELQLSHREDTRHSLNPASEFLQLWSVDNKLYFAGLV